jgi:hypothetical protein
MFTYVLILCQAMTTPNMQSSSAACVTLEMDTLERCTGTKLTMVQEHPSEHPFTYGACVKIRDRYIKEGEVE